MRDGRTCAGCGYLGISSREHPGDLDHVGSDYRANGQHDWNGFNPIPQCYKLAYSLPDEWESHLAQLAASKVQNPNRQAAVLVIQKPREACTQWDTYIPGLSPKARAAMIQQDKAFDIQQKLLDVQAKMFNLQESVADWKRAQADKERSAWWWTQFSNAIISVICAVIAAIATLAAAGKL